MKKNVISVVCTLIFLFLVQLSYSQYKISGRIPNYDSLWSNQLFLSLVEPGVPFWHISRDQIINSTTLDENGNFTLEGNLLPKKNSIVRLYLTETGIDVLLSDYPRNYLLLIMNNQSQINIETEVSCLDSLNYNVTGDLSDQNQAIIKLKDILGKIRCSNSNQNRDSQKLRELYESKYTNSIRDFCHDTKYTLVKLLALQNLKIEDDYAKNQTFYTNLLAEVNNDPQNSLPYVIAFKEKINSLQKFKSEDDIGKRYTLLVIILFIIIIILICYLIYLKSSISRKYQRIPDSNTEHIESLVSKLTQSEKKILSLLIKGLQNKEIANRLHVEVSTVKTHLTSLYKKLGINSRKEIMLFKNIILPEKD